MRSAAVLGAAIVLLLGALFVARPFVAVQRDIPASVPSPASLDRTATVPIERGTPTCFADAAIETHSEEMRFKVASPDGPAPAIRVHITGGGYDYTGELPPGTLDTQLVQVPIPAAPAALPVRVCFRTVGAAPGQRVGLYASDDRTRSRSLAYVGDQVINASIWFSFNENFPHTIAERLPATVDRMTVFRPWYVSTVVVWVLMALFLLGVPAAVVWAYVRGLGDDERAAPRDVEVNRARSWWQRLVG